ncbi:uncharacterized protein LOC132654460 [Meriones unguiculatus]|uniref:uncharacterized protein LOC132654460 n=1 Tax=Meriones unguiculatus TaxID=10047 RepID=UPI00293EFD75|nr:uncharacterized protein LOC132654460 [Meriones unguiculatus]
MQRSFSKPRQEVGLPQSKRERAAALQSYLRHKSRNQLREWETIGTPLSEPGREPRNWTAPPRPQAPESPETLAPHRSGRPDLQAGRRGSSPGPGSGQHSPAAPHTGRRVLPARLPPPGPPPRPPPGPARAPPPLLRRTPPRTAFLGSTPLRRPPRHPAAARPPGRPSTQGRAWASGLPPPSAPGRRPAVGGSPATPTAPPTPTTPPHPHAPRPGPESYHRGHSRSAPSVLYC